MNHTALATQKIRAVLAVIGPSRLATLAGVDHTSLRDYARDGWNCTRRVLHACETAIDADPQLTKIASAKCEVA